ncbi:MAG: hypothetical protein IT509_03980 [Rhodocyclaceae bacterium]|nr:hypothetical protein [Rhodocyclaceae bacterium]
MKRLLHYPRSFKTLLILGFTLVALPLAVGLASSALSIRSLSDNSVRAVYQASRASQASRSLAENLVAQERAVRQFMVFGDDGLWGLYVALHARFVDIAEQLAAVTSDAAQRKALAGLVDVEKQLHDDLRASRVKLSPRAQREWQVGVAKRFNELADIARELLGYNGTAIEREVGELRRSATDAERAMLIQLLTLVALAVFLVVGFARVLAGPIAQLGSAIDGLRAGRYERGIAVHGPSDLQCLGEELDRLRLRLVYLEEQKSRFLRHISHELKTPLTALREGSDLLAEETAGPLSSQQREIVGILIENSLRLRTLIEDLLSYSAADFEQAALRLQVFPLRELVEAVVESQRLAWLSRGLRIEVDVADIVLKADRERIRTVIDNLLSNAIKYSPPGGVIAMHGHREGDEISFVVADQGPGVDEADRPRVFDPFFRGRVPAGGAIKGSGLGLAIAREHVLAHGGSLRLLPGAGARFVVRLPLQ